jgi:hypothetical protein
MLIYHGILYEYNKNIKIIIIKIIFLKLQEYKNITKNIKIIIIKIIFLKLQEYKNITKSMIKKN